MSWGVRMQYKTIGEICTVVSGTTPRSDKAEYWGGNLIWITPAELKEGNAVIYDSVRHITKAAVKASALKPFPKGTVILSSRAPIGKVAIAGTKMYCNQGFKNLICSEAIYNGYLYYYLKAKTAYLNSLGRGATFREISKQIVEEIKIPVPSMQEQHRIADILFKIDALMGKRQQQAEKLDELVKARFVEMFGDPVLNCQGFPVRTIGELTTEVKYGTSKPAVEGGKYPYLRMNNLTIDGKLDLHDLKQIDVDTSEFEKCVVRKGDVLFNRTNSAELVGKTAYYGLDEEMIIAGYIIRVRVNNLILPQYLSFYMNMPFMKQRIRSMAKGAVNQANINSKELKSIKVIVPPLEVQGKVVEYEERIDREKDRIQRSAALLETLKRSLMQQYFG